MIKKTKTSNAGGGMKTSRDWAEIYSIYGLVDPQTFLFLLLHFLTFSSLSLLLFLTTTTFLPPSAAVISTTLLLSLSLLLSLFSSSSLLRWRISQRMLSLLPSDFISSVHTALDLGCGRGILLNSLALHLKKHHNSSARVVGLDSSRPRTLQALHAASLEGVSQYVTCREGDVTRLPFKDRFFDVVVSAAAIRRAGGREERDRVVREMVRVLKEGGVGVVWDLQHVPEYVRKLKELGMDEVRVSERVTGYMVSSHIVSFRKPKNVVEERKIVVGNVYDFAAQVRLDWRCHNLC